MAIAIRGTPQSGTNGVGRSVAVNVPAGVQNGDLLIANILGISATAVAASTPVDPTGWVRIGNVNSGATGSSNVSTSSYYRVASSEPASYTFSVVGGDNVIDADITAYFDPVTPLNVLASVSATGTAVTETSADPGTTPVDGAWHLISFRNFNGIASGFPPAGYTSDLQYDGANALCHKPITPIGATGAQSITLTAAGKGWANWALIIGAPFASFATLAELKAHVNIPSTNVSNDAELQTFLGASSEIVEAMIGPPKVATFTELYSTVDGSVIFMRRPLVSVTSVTPMNGSALGTALPSTGYLVDKDRGGLEITSGAAGDYTIVYTAGWSPIPARAKLAQLVIAQHLWRTQRGGMVPSVVADEAVSAVPGFGFSIPSRALELLASLGGPSMIPGIA